MKGVFCMVRAVLYAFTQTRHFWIGMEGNIQSLGIDHMIAIESQRSNPRANKPRQQPVCFTVYGFRHSSCWGLCVWCLYTHFMMLPALFSYLTYCTVLMNWQWDLYIINPRTTCTAARIWPHYSNYCLRNSFLDFHYLTNGTSQARHDADPEFPQPANKRKGKCRQALRSGIIEFCKTNCQQTLGHHELKKSHLEPLTMPH